MANTYTRFYVHLVFAVRYRKALIQKTWKDEFEKYITGIIQTYNHKLLAVGTQPDHIHIFIGYNVNHLIPDLVEEIKTSTGEWIKRKNLSTNKFAWQNGYGAFTHSRSQIDAVVKYIMNQEKHHKKKRFKEEYLEILAKNAVEFKNEYLFEFFDDVEGWE
jgi:REP element-mobilizing transposase RayT